GWEASQSDIRAISPAASASVSQSPPSPSPTRTFSSSTSRPAASTPIAGRSLPAGCSRKQRRGAALCWRPTIVVCPPIVVFGSEQDQGPESAPSPSRRNSLPPSRRWLAAFGVVALGASAWAALDPAHGGLAVLLAAVAVLAVGFAWLERGTSS